MRIRSFTCQYTSVDEIRRHIRLTFLQADLLQLVDDGNLPFIAGVELSYLSEPQQLLVHNYFFQLGGNRLDIKTDQAIRQWIADGKQLDTEDDLSKLLRSHQKKTAKPSKTISFKRKLLAPYLDRIPKDTNLEKLFVEFLRERFG